MILAPPEDDHAQAVQAALASIGARATAVDLSLFPQEMRLVIRYQRRRHLYELVVGEETLSLARRMVVWWWRPQPFILHPEISSGKYAAFAYNESAEAFAGLWECLDAAWVNQPTKEQTAARKVFQLRVAQELDLEVPRTLVTNDADAAAGFVDDLGGDRVAYKAFMPTEGEWRETRILHPGELARIDAVGYAPVIFQEYVPAQVDLRVTLVGSEVFAAAIHTPQTAYEADYRMDMDSARVEPFELPVTIREQLGALATRLGLSYAAIDMRLTPDGRYVFLEVNPSGQWLFVEERTGQPITLAFARHLAAQTVLPLGHQKSRVTSGA